jgi:hypothetical protein
MAKTGPIRQIVVIKSESAKISCKTAGLTASKVVQGQKIAMAEDIRARLNFLPEAGNRHYGHGQWRRNPW